jgi:hypothetical protein
VLGDLPVKAIIFVLGALTGAVVTFSLMQPPPLPPDIQALVQKYATPVPAKRVPSAALPPGWSVTVNPPAKDGHCVPATDDPLGIRTYVKAQR